MLNKFWAAVLTVAILLLASCGSGQNLQAEFESSDYDLSKNFSSAVWHDGNNLVLINPQYKDEANSFVAPIMILEDGQLYENVLMTKPPLKENAKSIFGIYQIDIPDADQVTFIAKIGFPYLDDPVQGGLLFKFYIQDGDFFSVLAEFETAYDRRLEIMQADMTAYRGKNAFIMVSVEHVGEAFPDVQGAWVSPKISYEFY